MGFLQWSSNHTETFNNFEIILNKTTLSLIHVDIKQTKSEEERDNFIFITSIINYYQSLKNNKNNIYCYYTISYKTKNISSFISIKKAKDIFLNWSKLLYKTKRNNNDYVLDNKEVENNQIKKDIFIYIKQNKLLNIFIENFNKYYNNVDNKSFVKLILSGLPDFLRPFIWKIILEKKNKNYKKTSIKQYLIENKNNQNVKQIYKDINRTFIIKNEDNNSTIEKIDDEKINKLKNVLIAISNYDSEIGYTQGMNNIIGFLLKVTKFNEEKTFDLALLIMDKIKGYFTKDFPLLKENLQKFNNLFRKRNNKLYNHFKKYEIIDELWIGKWIQTLFTINFQFYEACRIWDSLIVFGFDFIIYLSLSIIYFAEDYLLKLNDSSDIINYLIEMMNPNPNKKKNYNEEPNYKDYIIPIYTIISQAKKIKRDILLELSYYNVFNNNNLRSLNYFYETEKKDIFLSKNSCRINNNSISKLNNSNKKEINERINLINVKSLRPSSSSDFLLNNNKNKDFMAPLNLKEDHKKENNKILYRNDSNEKNGNFNYNYKKKDSNENKEINTFSPSNIHNNNMEKSTNRVRKFSDCSDISFAKRISERSDKAINKINYTNNTNNINIINNINFNNYLKSHTNSYNYSKFKNNCAFPFNGINLNIKNNNKNNFINGRPRINKNYFIKKNNIVNPLEHIIRNRNMLSKSPQYYRPQSIYAVNKNIGYNNIRYGFIQNNYLDIYNNNNNCFNNLQKRGSYNIPLPIKYCYGYQITK